MRTHSWRSKKLGVIRKLAAAIIVAMALAGCAAQSRPTQNTDMIRNALPDDGVEMILGQWTITGEVLPPIALTNHGGMWCGHFPYEDAQLEGLVRHTSALGRTVKLLVHLADGETRTARDFYNQIWILRSKVARALTPGGKAIICVYMDPPSPDTGTVQNGPPPLK